MTSECISDVGLMKKFFQNFDSPMSFECDRARRPSADRGLAMRVRRRYLEKLKSYRNVVNSKVVDLDEIYNFVMHHFSI